MIRMQVYRVGVDPQRRVPFVLLADDDLQRLLPIYVGPFEANAIATQLQGSEFPRPLTHDLMRTLVEELGYELSQVSITELRDSTFFAVLHLEGMGRTLELDARPSDAIALALRTRSPIFVADEVVATASIPYDEVQETSEKSEEIDRFRELLGDLPASDEFLDADEGPEE